MGSSSPPPPPPLLVYSYFERTRHSRKVIWDKFNTLFPTPQLSNLLLLLSFSTRKPTNFFEKQSTQNYPQYLSELSRALFSTIFLEIAVFTNSKKEIWGIRFCSSVRLINILYYACKSLVPCISR